MPDPSNLPSSTHYWDKKGKPTIVPEHLLNNIYQSQSPLDLGRTIHKWNKGINSLPFSSFAARPEIPTLRGIRNMAEANKKPLEAFLNDWLELLSNKELNNNPYISTPLEDIIAGQLKQRQKGL